MTQRHHFFSPSVLWLLAAGLACAGCRAGDDDRPGASTVITAVDPAPDAARSEAAAAPPPRPDAWVAGDADRVAGEADNPVEDGRLARIDARLLDLQAAINQLAATGDDRAECESRWEELDARRTALRREERGLDDEVTASDRAERRRVLARELDDLERDLETALQEVESRLARG